jgi:hypothetical protein
MPKRSGFAGVFALILLGSTLAACQKADITDVAPDRSGGSAGSSVKGGPALPGNSEGGTGGGTGSASGARGNDPDDRGPASGGAGGTDVDSGARDAAVAEVQPQQPPAQDCRCGAQEICVNGRCKDRGTIITPPFDTCADPPCINVLNNCGVPLWTHAVATVPIDDGNVRKLEPGASFRYTALPSFGGGRLYAYYKEPEVKQNRERLVSDYNQFVEMTIDRDGSGHWAQNYNISYVDSVALPVAMKGQGAGCQMTHCGFRYEDWVQKLKECPTDLRNQHGDLATCTASYNYCITPEGAGPATYDATKEYCTKMQDAHGAPGSTVYGGTFPQHPATEVDFWDRVAAWNRGTIAGDANEANYYRNEPFNQYAAWIHERLGCPRVYAFSTDDHQDKAGFVRCTADELTVVWCPNE